MNETELQQFRQLLLTEKQSLLAVAADTQTAAQSVTLDQPSVDRVARIAGALRRVEAGDFGYCYVCDDEIDLQRLRFDPTTTRCVSCKSDDGAS